METTEMTNNIVWRFSILAAFAFSTQAYATAEFAPNIQAKLSTSMVRLAHGYVRDRTTSPGNYSIIKNKTRNILLADDKEIIAKPVTKDTTPTILQFPGTKNNAMEVCGTKTSGKCAPPPPPPGPSRTSPNNSFGTMVKPPVVAPKLGLPVK
jgi:hypothetical protein